MSVRVGIWALSEGVPHRAERSKVALEVDLEDWCAHDPALIDDRTWRPAEVPEKHSHPHTANQSRYQGGASAHPRIRPGSCQQGSGPRGASGA